MKTLLTLSLLAVMLTINAKAQNQSFDRLFDRYAEKDGFVTLRFTNLPLGMLDEGKQDPQLKISSLRVLTIQDEKLNAGLNFYNEIVPQINRRGYEELMAMKHNGEKAILLCKKDKKRITEVLFVAGGRNNAMIEITGSMSLEQAQKITSQMTTDQND